MNKNEKKNSAEKNLKTLTINQLKSTVGGSNNSSGNRAIDKNIDGSCKSFA